MNTYPSASRCHSTRPGRVSALLACLLIVALLLPGSAGWTVQAAPPTQDAPPDRLPYDGSVDLPRQPGVAPQTKLSQALLSPESVDWSKLVFQSARNNSDWEVYAARGDGSNQINISNHGSIDLHPRLNRGATRVIFASNRHGTYDLFTMNADGGGQTRIVDSAGDDVFPAWSPDGSRIAFQAYRDGQPEIYVANADGSGQTRLTNHGDYDGQPAWSPDGSQIAFVRRAAGQYLVWAMNADGSNQRPLSNQAYSADPAWSPDGSQIAYDADGNGDGWQEIWLMNADGSNQRQVYAPPEGNTDAWVGSWSPDSRYVAFTRISFVNDQGQWYWTTAYLDAWDSTQPWNTIRLSSNGADWNPDWQSTDAQAPNSAVYPLPAYSHNGLQIRWGGDDLGGSGILSYDIQYRTASTTWTNWQMETPATSAVFTGTIGVAYSFRARARDNAQNVEAWPLGGAGDTSTTLFRWRLSGRITDNRDTPISGADVQIAPIPLQSVSTDIQGQFVAYLDTTGDYTVSVNRPGYGLLSPPAFAMNQDRSVQMALPPLQNLVTNGGFETGQPLPSGWTIDGPPDTYGVSPVAHTGERSLGLGRPCQYPCLSQPETLADYSNDYPDMASDSRGNVYLVWHGMPGGNSRALAMLKSPDGVWSQPEDLGPLSGNDWRVSIAVDGNDVAHAVWSQSDGVYYRQRAPGSTWSQPQQLVVSGGRPDVAADRLGGVHIIYFDYDSGTHYVRYLERLPSGVWQAPVILDENPFGGAAIAAGPDASVHFLYQKAGAGVFYRTRPREGGICPAEQLLTSYGYTWAYQSLTVGSDGTVHAAMNGTYQAYYRQRPVGGPWSPLEPLNTWAASALAVDSAGTLHVSGWTDSGPYRLYYRHRTPGGVWQNPAILGMSNNDGPSLAVDPLGQVHIVCFLMEPSQGLYYWRSADAQDSFTVHADQQITIPSGTHRPTVTAFHWSQGANAPFSIWVQDGVASTQVFSGTTTNTWHLAFADLSPWAGQPITLSLRLRQEAGAPYNRTLLDDITLGEWPTPLIDTLHPNQAPAWAATPIVIHGDNFISTPAVNIGPVAASSVTWIDEHRLNAVVPGTLAPGLYDVRVTNPGGASSDRVGAFRSGRSYYLPVIIVRQAED